MGPATAFEGWNVMPRLFLGVCGGVSGFLRGADWMGRGADGTGVITKLGWLSLYFHFLKLMEKCERCFW